MGIKVLDKITAEQIAAGEVIENPASVVKELVENAVDAGATRINVELEEGGKKSIAVTDNGCGIPAPELPLAFQRFATSKLSILGDLEHISSLGFRGEALPSIAAVAKVRLVTRAKGCLAASEITIEGSTIINQAETGAPPGTRVEVRNLFFNTPGRLKFLRAASVESTRVSTLLSEMSLAHPQIAFSLKSGKRELFSSPGDGVLLHAIASLYGPESAKAMIELKRKDKPSTITLHGYTSSPYLTRSSRRWISLIINGRLIKNSTIINALERAYGELLPGRRHPLAVLILTIPPQKLDVNVHPAKIEIRFQDPETVKSIVYRTAKLALQQNQNLPDWPGQEVSKESGNQAGTSIYSDKYTVYPGLNKSLTSEDTELLAGKHRPENHSLFNWQENSNSHLHNYPHQKQPGRVAEEQATGNKNDSLLIGQYLQSYLLVQKGEDLLLIDQHAAHERIHYHRLINNKPVLQKEESVQLTLPLTISTPAAWRSKIPELLPLLNKFGFDLEPLGKDNYVLRAVPFMLRGQAEQTSIYDLLENLVNENTTSEQDPDELILKTIACHRSVKAKQPLTRDEMEQLLFEWENTPLAEYCPHGRPTVIRFNRSQLEKSFHRPGNTNHE
ncbi:MAG: DNA mismatch repair endonuclease MutL [Bacillota bacterium]